MDVNELKQVVVLVPSRRFFQLLCSSVDVSDWSQTGPFFNARYRFPVPMQDTDFFNARYRFVQEASDFFNARYIFPVPR